MLELFIKVAIEWTYSNTNWLWFIPLVSGIIGWLTNVLALQMTFYPLEFKGIGRLGWQGIIPSRSTQIAETAVDLMLGQVINLSEQFTRIDPQKIVELHYDTLHYEVEKAIEIAFLKNLPIIGQFLPQVIKNVLTKKIMQEVPTAIEHTIIDIQAHIDELLDVKAMVTQQLESDKTLLNQIFLDCGKQEFEFIKQSGFYFGGLFGCIQLAMIDYHQSWVNAWYVLPIGGLLIGFLTNWLALKLIFYPRIPIKIGNWTIQGLFLKRQQEVAQCYAALVANKLLTTQKIFESMLYQEPSRRLHTIIQNNIAVSLQQTRGIWGRLFRMLNGSFIYQYINEQITKHVYIVLPSVFSKIQPYITTKLAIEKTIQSKMSALSPTAYEGFLRPVFKADEWKLILLGTILGGLVGGLQWVFLGG